MIHSFRIGSPPHTRGTANGKTATSTITGITPAYAGNSPVRGSIPRQSQDHPRIRGEQLFAVIIPKVVPGSPPHTRGTDNEEEPVSEDFRITPAYPGNSRSCLSDK